MFQTMELQKNMKQKLVEVLEKSHNLLLEILISLSQ